MKRASLFGLGSFFIMGVIGALVELHFIVALIFMPVSVITIRAAGRAPPNHSRSYAIIGCLLGFLVFDAVILAVVGVVLLASPAQAASLTLGCSGTVTTTHVPKEGVAGDPEKESVVDMSVVVDFDQRIVSGFSSDAKCQNSARR